MKRLIALLSLLAMFAMTSDAATLSLLMAPKARFMNATGTAALASGKLYFCEPGSTCPGTPKATYTDSTGATANASPVILNARGETTVYLNGSYKVVLQSSTGATQWTQDNVSVAVWQSAVATYTQWTVVGATPSYINTTQFSVPSDYTTTFEVGRRLKAVVTAGTIFGTISVSSYAGGITTVTIVPDSTTLDSGLNSIEVGILTITNPSRPIFPTKTKTTGYTIMAEDHGYTLIANLTSASTWTLPAATAVPNGFNVISKNTNTFVLTIKPPSGNVDASASITVNQWGESNIFSNGASWYTHP